MANNKLIGEFTTLSKEMLARAASDRDAEVKRMLGAGASPLMVDALMDVARKEMWAVLFSHLVEVAISSERDDLREEDDMALHREYADGIKQGILTCISNIFSYAEGGSAGSA